jgi:hypothetical protein
MFGRSKKTVTINHVTLFDAALAQAIANAQKGRVSASTLMARLEAAAEGFRWASHAEAERRQSPAGNPIAVNQVWFDKEKARLIAAGEWPH